MVCIEWMYWTGIPFDAESSMVYLFVNEGGPLMRSMHSCIYMYILYDRPSSLACAKYKMVSMCIEVQRSS